MNISISRQKLSLLAMEATADPSVDPELAISVDGKNMGTFAVDGSTIDPNSIPAVLISTPFTETRQFLSAVSRGKTIRVVAKTFDINFDLRGVDIAVGQLFECADLLPRHGN